MYLLVKSHPDHAFAWIGHSHTPCYLMMITQVADYIKCSNWLGCVVDIYECFDICPIGCETQMGHQIMIHSVVDAVVKQAIKVQRKAVRILSHAVETPMPT